ncbi:TetR/AcrR family transcriptional regulator [Glycomyces rhizosphaerae]|uniref:TetR/AcrR family transcriptional regulator n=1 Tax=Glycomyces rhizosphaerae TaxID=2054422 RepID=A0ABV7PZQ7_9ACTN
MQRTDAPSRTAATQGGSQPMPQVGGELSRADARRNRAKVLAAAQAAFAKEGTGVSLGEIARRAGVGAGTVYRHFPTKDVLLEAVMAQRVERLTRLAVEYAASSDPGAAFFDFVTEVVTSTPGNQDMCDLLESEDGWPRSVLLSTGRRFAEALEALLSSAQERGEVRADLDVEGVKAIFTGCVAIQRLQQDPRTLAPMSALVIDALRPNGGAVTDTDKARKIRDENPSATGKRNDESAACGVCGSPLARTGPGRPPRFCGPACRQKAYRQRRTIAAIR